MKPSRRSILSLFFGAAAAPVAVAVAKAMLETNVIRDWRYVVNADNVDAHPIARVVRVRLPNDYQFVDTPIPGGVTGRTLTLEEYARRMFGQPNPFLDEMLGFDD
jgi:hypothetical protein